MSVSREALTGDQIMGFEATSAWTAPVGPTLSLEPFDRTQGSFSLEVRTSGGYTTLNSAKMPSLARVSSRLALDVELPTTSPPIPSFGWQGAIQLYVTIPSLNMFNAYLGQVELNNIPSGGFHTVEFSVPNDVITKLLGSYTDLFFSLALNTPNCSNTGSCSRGGYRFDNLRFLPNSAASCSAAVPNGTLCDDGNGCTQTDTCQGGFCVGSNVKQCPASDQCHAAGVCNATTGQCPNAPVANGTPCNDGSRCTLTDTCQGGVCVGTNLTGECVPGLVMGLLHNQNQTTAETVMYSALHTEAIHRDGGDLGADNHRGYEWWQLPDSPDASAASFHLPPGVVVALKHSANQASLNITAFGHNAVAAGDFPGFKRQNGGDRGADSGVGYYWYESTGEGFTDWANVDALLPKFTVVGLKHSLNQPNKVLVWNGQTFDPVQPSPVPPGFRRMNGGDLGDTSAGQGYYWYEKTTGDEITSIPSRLYTLPRSLNLQPQDPNSADQDKDCLVDSMESQLANSVRPFVVFDSNEIARQSFEPVTVFRLYATSPNTIRIRWVFLFANDGGYGPAASFLCGNSHIGDNDSADFDLTTPDGGVTWVLGKVEVSFRGLNWPGNSRLEVFDKQFPVVYLSASKHHEYLTRDNDEKDSLYSDAPIDACDDNVNGRGFSSLVDLSAYPTHNAGEPGFPLLNELDPLFPGTTLWDPQRPFYNGSNAPKFDGTANPVLPAAFTACQR